MKITVTGSTGLIGTHLIPKLIDGGHEVTIITRNRQNAENLSDEVKIVEGNLYEMGNWCNIIKSEDVIINLAGENIFSKRWTNGQKKKILDSRSIITNNLASVVESEDGNISQIISMSGVDYYPSDLIKTYNEEDNPADGFLGEVCKNWEKPILGISKENVKRTVLRMGVVFSKTGKGAEKMFLPHKLMVGGKLGSGKQIYSWLHIDDFVGSILFAIDEQLDGVFNVVSPDTKSMKELAVIGGKILKRPTWTWLPGFILKIVLGERAVMLLEGRVVSPEKIINKGFTYKFIKAEDALSDILSD